MRGTMTETNPTANYTELVNPTYFKCIIKDIMILGTLKSKRADGH